MVILHTNSGAPGPAYTKNISSLAPIPRCHCCPVGYQTLSIELIPAEIVPKLIDSQKGDSS